MRPITASSSYQVGPRAGSDTGTLRKMADMYRAAAKPTARNGSSFVTFRPGSAVWGVGAPAVKHTGHLYAHELEEPRGVLQSTASAGVMADRIDSLATQSGPLSELVLPVADHLVPVVGHQSVDVSPLAGSVGTGNDTQLDKVAHRPGDRGRARLKGV